MKRIGIDVRPFETAYAGRGIGHFLRNLLPRLCASRIGPRLVLIGTAAKHPPFDARYERIWRPKVKAWAFEQLLWPADMVRLGLGVYHSTVSLGPLRSIGLPYVSLAETIATVHDLTAFHLPQYRDRAGEKHLAVQLAALKRAAAIVAVSAYVRDDITARLGIPTNRITVISEAVDDRKRMIADSGGGLKPKDGRPYILAMGEDVQKNIATVIRVYERMAVRGYDGGLVIIGSRERQNAAVLVLVDASRFRTAIRFTGPVSDEELVGLYANAALFLFPSLSEGFGLPVIEAMYCGTPVLTSNVTSLPEAGGDAALYHAPEDVDGFTADGMKLLADSGFRESVVTKGWAHARSLSWDDAAGKLVELYETL